MSLTSQENEFEAFNVNAKRTDFSGLFGSASRGEQLNSPPQNVATRRRRPREIIPLQFEPDFEDMDAKEEMSMEALHFFGLSNDLPSAPVTPKLFENLCEDDESPNLKKRQRHFSLEDYNAMDESEDSTSSSNLSHQLSPGLNTLVCSKRVRQNSIFSNFDDSAIGFSNNSALSSSSASNESFSFGQQSRRNSSEFFSTNFLSDIPFSSQNMSALELDNDHIAHQLRSELEIRLLETLCPVPGAASASEVTRRRYAFELPPQLLAIIAAHVIQEAANEPYGLKGCLLHIYYESETDNEFVASLDCDPETLSTFELTLTLRQDPCRRRGWRNKLPELVRSFSTFGFGSVLVGTSYKLVKRRNYRTNVDESEATLLKL